MREVVYKEFRVGDLFDIHPTKAYKGNNSDLFSSNGTIPVVANSGVNNGVGGFSEFEPTEKGGIITFSDTTTSDAVFYQPNDFIGYAHVQGMYPFSNKWTEKALLYFLSSFKRIASSMNFDYANKFNRKIAANFIVSLPSTLIGEPDYEYMEAFINELEQERINELEQYLAVTGLGDYELTNEEKEILFIKKETSSFRMGDLFNFKAIKQAKSQNLIPEDQNGVPYIVQSTRNNMYKTHVSEQWLIDNNEPPVDGNAIILGVTLPAVSYQPEKFGASQVIVARAPFLNENIGLFIVSILRKYMEMFSYQKKPGLQIYKALLIDLPITSAGEPDFEYMDKYIRVQEKLAIKGVVEYKDRFIKETKMFVG